MGYYNDNLLDDTPLEFPRTGFWIIHVLGILIVFWLGMRFAIRRAPLAIFLYRMMKMFRLH